MKNRYLLGAGVALALAFGGVQAQAQFLPLTGPQAWYVGPEGGFTSLGNQNDDVTTVPFTVNGAGPFSRFTGRTNYDAGFNVGGRGGYQWGPLRIEEEYNYRHSDLSSFAGITAGSRNNLFEGQRNTNAIMTNVIYDFTIGFPVTPHVGFGVGAVEINDSVGVNPFVLGPISGATPAGPYAFPTRVYGGTLLKNNNSWQFGYQAIAGFRYDINPLLAFDLDYRYLATTENTVSNRGLFPLPPVGVPSRYKTGYNTNNVVASLTLKFGPPPPAPPPAVPPAPPPAPPHQVYLVFFDWDRYNITPEGQQILVLAANQYKSGAPVRIQVTGYTDLSGSAGYNQRLSERRANAVAAALERLGVPRSDMVVTGRGMNDPRVPTPLGVREPQNRRVEIVFP